jgi:ABC-type transport system substrate-binding protein
VLTLAIQNELKGFISEFTLENTRVGGVRQPKPIVHNLLTVENDRAQFLPELATEQISIEKGTWTLNPDRSMDTTWRIHPNVKWHDGSPFTSDDLMFSFTVFTDPLVPNRVGPASKLMASATAPDPLTLVVHWSAPYVDTWNFIEWDKN